jgi:hypothetical protein
MTKRDDSKAGRKESAGSADDQTVFNDTPFGRQRKPGSGRTFFIRLVHVLGFPFFYVYNQMRNRKSSGPQKWFDDSGRHGVASESRVPGEQGRS